MLEIFEKLLKQVDNRARFLSGVLSDDIKCINMKKHELRQEFMEKGFDPLPKEGQPVAVGATGNKEENGVCTSDYDYLISMSVSSLTEEYLEHLLELRRRFEIKVGLLRKAAPQYLKSEKEPRLSRDMLLHSNYKKAQSGREVMMDISAKDSKVFEAVPRRQLKRAAAGFLEASPVLMDDDEEEAPELKDQSQENTETKCSQKQERKNQRKRRKKQRRELCGRGTSIHCRRELDFQGHDKSGDGLLVEEIKRIASGLDGIEITHCNKGQNRVANELSKLSLPDAFASLCHEDVV